MVAGTNGRMYIDLIGKLDRLPIPDIPIPATEERKLLLDIGCGWGRWMCASAAKGYVPVGIDIDPEAARTSLEVVRSQARHGFAVVANMKELPFATGLFDAVWSFSVIQHTHKEFAQACLDETARCLRPDGFLKIELPAKYGPRNLPYRMVRGTSEEDDYDSWAVRYYSMGEIRRMMDAHYCDIEFAVHCYFGIGLLPIDLEFVPMRYRAIVAASLSLTRLSRYVPPARHVADSLWISARPAPAPDKPTVGGAAEALKDPEGNLAIIPYLRCPQTGQPLRIEEGKLITEDGKWEYPLDGEIPIMLASEARQRT